MATTQNCAMLDFAHLASIAYCACGLALAIIVALLVYHAFAFGKYTNSSPKQLLAFHAGDSPLAKSKSPRELIVFMEQLEAGGLLDVSRINFPEVSVNPEHWKLLSERERAAFVRILSRYAHLTQVELFEIRIVDIYSSEVINAYPSV